MSVRNSEVARDPDAERGGYAAMLTPKARGAMSESLFEALRMPPEDWTEVCRLEPESDQDAQIALWTLYELSYGGFADVDDDLEWHPDVLRMRRRLEVDLEDRLRQRFTHPQVDEPFEEAFFDFVASHDGASMAAFVQRQADVEQVLELLRHRSVYHLKESDPTSWVVPRLPVQTKAALMELQYDEYGAGDPNRLHSHLFAKGLYASGLSSEYGAYVDDAPGEVLEQNNAMSLLGLHRRLRGAALGHLAAFEVTSSVPSRQMVQGLVRLGFPRDMVAYYEEHIEADAVHEQLAVRTICASLLAEEPLLTRDVFFGAFTCLDLEDRLARRLLNEWA